ncbi:MAG: MFS transporter [Armatimonadota bacterium]
MSDPQHEFRTRRLIVAVYSFGICLAFCLLAVPVPVLAREQFKATDAQIGILGTVGMLCYAAGAFIGGRLADRVSYRRIIVMACLTAGVFAALYPLLPDFWLLVAANALMFLGLSFFWPTLMAWMSASMPARLLPGILMVFNVGWSTGQLGDYLGGAFYDIDPRLAFFLAAGLAVLFALVTLLLPGRIWRKRAAEPAETELPEEHDIRPPGADRFVWLGWSSVFTATILVAGLRTLFPPMAADMQFSGRVIGLLLMAVPAMQVVAFLLLGRWHGWHYRFWPLALAQVVGAAGCWVAARAGGPWGFAAGFFLIGILVGLAVTCSLFYSVHGQANTGLRAGLHEGISGLGAIAGPALFGIVSQLTNARMPYYVSAVLLLALIVSQIAFSLLWQRRAKKTVAAGLYARGR